MSGRVRVLHGVNVPLPDWPDRLALELFENATEPDRPHCAAMIPNYKRGSYGPWCHVNPNGPKGDGKFCGAHRPDRYMPRGTARHVWLGRGPTVMECVLVRGWFEWLGGAEAFDALRSLERG